MSVPFLAALKAVAPHMSNLDAVPVLKGVHLRPGLMVATDRYTMAFAAYDVEDFPGVPDEGFTLEAADVKALLRVKVVKDNPRGRFELEEPEASGRYANIRLGSTSMRVRALDQKYPDVLRVARDILNAPEASAGSGAWGIQPKFTDRLAPRHIGKDASPVWSHRMGEGKDSEKKGIVVRLGDWFTAIIATSTPRAENPGAPLDGVTWLDARADRMEKEGETSI